jgi:hypothetical protein
MGKSGSEGRGEQTTARKRGIGGAPLTLLPEAQSPEDGKARVRRKDTRDRRHALRRHPTCVDATFGVWSVAQ